jgi:hypothetical protein
MVIAVFITTFILIVPLVFSVYFHFEKSLNKGYFAIYIFGFIRLVSGYVCRRKDGGLYVHFSDKKALILQLYFIKKLESDFSFLSVISINNIYLSTSIGFKSAMLLTFATTLTTAIQTTSKIIEDNGYGKRVVADLIVYNEDKLLKSMKMKFKFSFNLISIVIIFIANYISKVKSNVKGKKIKFKQ